MAAVMRERGGVSPSPEAERSGVEGVGKRMVAVRSEAGVDVAAYSRANDEAVACSGARIENGRWRRHDGY
jgi:hypothetical protein